MGRCHSWGKGEKGGSRTAPTGGECCRVRGSPPSPVFTRAGSNLPPSRGKGFVGAKWAIFLVMTCGWRRGAQGGRGAWERGMGPRIREDNGRGRGLHPHPNLPPSRGKGGGWVPACARTTVFQPRLRQSRGMGPRMREDNGRGRVPTGGGLLNLRCGLGRKAGLF